MSGELALLLSRSGAFLLSQPFRVSRNAFCETDLRRVLQLLARCLDAEFRLNFIDWIIPRLKLDVSIWVNATNQSCDFAERYSGITCDVVDRRCGLLYVQRQGVDHPPRHSRE